jgi:RNA polymerase sigma-70 factor (ECF subfamily)
VSAEVPENFADLPLKGPREAAYGDDMEARASAWMTQAKRGDPGAFDELTRALRNRAFQIARAWVGSREDALELAQEAFLKTYRARDTYRDGEPFLPWFQRILRNTCFSFLRSTKRLKERSLSGGKEVDEPDWDIADPAEAAPADGLGGEERQQAFWRGFQRLSARDREILTLRHFQELPYSQIAKVLAIPEGTVMSRLFHARARLRSALGSYFEDELGGAKGDPR